MSTYRSALVIFAMLLFHAMEGKVPPSPQPVHSDFLRFEENKNQFDPRVLFEAKLTKSAKLFLEKNTFTYLYWNPHEIEQMHHGNSVDTAFLRKFGATVHFHCFKAEFLGANPDPVLSTGSPAPNYSNYYLGNIPEHWASNVRNYDEVTYHNLYPDLDLHVYSRDNNLKYDFIVNPGADPSNIRMEYKGADRLFLSKGNLNIQTTFGTTTEQKPFAYQIIGGKQVTVECRFVLSENTLSFSFPRGYDKSEVLVIDPTLIVSTYSGSTADNWGYTATYDNAGNIYAGGIGSALGYPTTVGAFQTTFGGGACGGNCYPFDITITKYNPTGSSLLYSTYLGGSDNEQPQSIVVDNNNNLYVMGRTYSSNFPVTAGAFSTTPHGLSDIIISKFNPTGTSLLASTLVGGTGEDGVNITSNFFTWNSLKYNYGDDGRSDIIVDNAGNCYVASVTQSTNFPVTPGAYQTSFGGGTQDGCVFKMNSNLTSMIWSTFLGGNADDACYSLALDATSNLYVTGGTSSSNFPTTPGALHTSYMGGTADGFITHLSASGTGIMQSSFVGTSAYDQSYFVQLDKQYNVYLFGQTAGAYLVTSGVYSNPNSGQFIHKISPTLNSTFYSTVFGNGITLPNISPSAFMVDTCENVYTSGWGGQCIPYGSTGTTTGLPVTSNAYQSTTDGCDFYFFVLKTNATSLWYATFFGGPGGTDEHVDGGTSRFDSRGVIYQSVCAGCGGTSAFPTTPGAWSNTNNSSNCNNAVIKLDFQLVSLNAIASASPSDSICIGGTSHFVNTSTGAHNYVWHFGDASLADTSKNPSHTYNSIGTYTVTLIAIDSASCKFADSTHLLVTVLPMPAVNLGPDTVTCGAINMNLNAGNPGLHYTWNTGATSQTLHVTSPGIYWVKVSNGHCSASDTIRISVLTQPNLGNDTSICAGKTITLNAGPPAGTYSWSTGATTNTITASAAGTYWVTSSAGNCHLTDTLHLGLIPIPLVNLGPDTTLCPGQSVSLNAGNPGASFLWSTGATSQTIQTGTTGSYWVTVTSGGCKNSDTLGVTKLVNTDLGPDKNTCEAPSVTLDAGNVTGAHYLWSTGDTTQTLLVSQTGDYWVRVSTGYCILSDTVHVDGGLGAPSLYVPDAFSPNGDGKNDAFFPKGIDITQYHLKIFDRWGELIFECFDMNKVWDGTYKGRLVQNDVYVWVIDYKTVCTGDTNVHTIGNVTVYR